MSTSSPLQSSQPSLSTRATPKSSAQCNLSAPPTPSKSSLSTCPPPSPSTPSHTPGSSPFHPSPLTSSTPTPNSTLSYSWLSLHLPPTSKRYPPTYSLTRFWDITLLLLQNPQFNSSHLFRADVLSDSWGVLEITNGREDGREGEGGVGRSYEGGMGVKGLAGERNGVEMGEEWELLRTVVRRLIPRNPNLDRRMEQTGFFYRRRRKSGVGRGAAVGRDDSKGCKGGDDEATEEEEEEGACLVVYTPHVATGEGMPWYHPCVKALAYLYEWSTATETGEISSSINPTSSAQKELKQRTGHLSLHFLPFLTSTSAPIPERLHRTALALLTTFHRIASSPNSNPNPAPAQTRTGPSSSDRAKQPTPDPDPINLALHPPKDGLIPRHRLQDTYTALKLRYATSLIEKWVEKTEPSKHVFEDLGIAAFLVELWRDMYGTVPKFEKEGQEGSGDDGKGSGNGYRKKFLGFVDIACGNGVLTHILLEEGYKGYGFDARRRKTWDAVFPGSTREYLLERICVPKPFLDSLRGGSEATADHVAIGIPEDEIHNGVFPPGTFIISNHADELTPWTPVFAATSQPEKPLPFLAIPCCSHALSGARNRYKVPKPSSGKILESGNAWNEVDEATNTTDGGKANTAPETGNLKAMRAEKQKMGGASSAYQALTAYTAWLALQLGFHVDTTLLRIPSTRNVGIVGRPREPGEQMKAVDKAYEEIVESECGGKGDDGVREAAMVWIDRIKGLRKGQGRGKLNLHCERNEINCDGHE